MNAFEEESVSGESFAEEDSDTEVNKTRKIVNFLTVHILTTFAFVVYLFDVQLQEAFARGDLKPGLNVEVGANGERKAVNNVVSRWL